MERRVAKIVPKISSLSFKYLLQTPGGFFFAGSSIKPPKVFSLQEAASNLRCKFGLKKEAQTASLPSKTTAFGAEWNLYAAKNFKIQMSPAPVIHMLVFQSSNNSSNFETRGGKLPKRARIGVKKDGALGHVTSPLPLSQLRYPPSNPRNHQGHTAEVALPLCGFQTRRNHRRGTRGRSSIFLSLSPQRTAASAARRAGGSA